MLEPAMLHSDEIRENFYRIFYDPEYQYYFGVDRRWTPDMGEDNDNMYIAHRFASIDASGKVIGYIGYTLNSVTREASSFGAINFYKDDGTITFARDLFHAINNLFMLYGCNVMHFFEIDGNPIGKTYDRLVKRYGGRLVGIQRDTAQGLDGRLLDTKIYEIHKDDYFRTLLAKKEYRNEEGA